MTLKKIKNGIDTKVKTHQTEFRFLHKNGTYLWILAQGSVVTDKSGRAIKIIGSHIDITERKLADQENEKLRTQLTQAQKMESIGTLAGGIAHDFNNILSSVLGYTELALDDVEKYNLGRQPPGGLHCRQTGQRPGQTDIDLRAPGK